MAFRRKTLSRRPRYLVWMWRRVFVVGWLLNVPEHGEGGSGGEGGGGESKVNLEKFATLMVFGRKTLSRRPRYLAWIWRRVVVGWFCYRPRTRRKKDGVGVGGVEPKVNLGKIHNFNGVWTEDLEQAP